MAIKALTLPAQPAIDNSFDFSALARLGQINQGNQNQNQNQTTPLTALGSQFGLNTQSTSPGAAGYAPAYTGSGSGEDNSKSWYDFAIKPADQGGLGLSPAQATGVVGNLQAESGSNVPSWGPTGDQGSAHGAAQWRLDRLANLQKYASDRGLDYRSTDAQQGFMKSELTGSERPAYDQLLAAQTPQAAADAFNRHYERSADRTGTREANAARLARRFGLLVGNQ